MKVDQFPHQKLPANHLSERQHQQAGKLAKSLMSSPAKPQKEVSQQRNSKSFVVL